MKETIPASQLKARCSEVLNRVERLRKSMTVTRRGKPIARLVPVDATESPRLYGALKGLVRLSGDVIAPIDVVWDAQR